MPKGEIHTNESINLDFMRLLDAVGRFNPHFGDSAQYEPEPEDTFGFTVDAQTAGYVARRLGVYPPFAWEVFGGMSCKEAKSIRDWLISKMDTDPEFDVLVAMRRYATKHGISVDEEVYREAREDLNARYATANRGG